MSQPDSFPFLRHEGTLHHTMSRIVAVANQKGGVGKTTTTVNLASAIALEGRSVLLIDMDPQGNATSGLGIDPRTLTSTVYDCLIDNEKMEKACAATTVHGLSILPANADLAGAEIELANAEGREGYLRRLVANAAQRYETVFIDCPPALGILTVNALTAASSVLIPVQCEYYAMEGLTRLISSIERIRQLINPALCIEGILLTMFDARNTLARQVSDQVRAHFTEMVYRTVIPRNIALAEAPSYGCPGILYNAASAGSQAYVALAKEFLEHGEKGSR